MRPDVSRLARFCALLFVAVTAFAAGARAQQPFDAAAWAVNASEWRVEA